MANRPAPALMLRPGDREELERRTRSDKYGASAAKRARILLLAAGGVANTRIAELTDATVSTVLNWGQFPGGGVALRSLCTMSRDITCRAVYTESPTVPWE